MEGPTEHKTVQARILAYTEAIGWTLVSQKAVFVLRLRRAKVRSWTGSPSRESHGETNLEFVERVRILKRKRRLREFPDAASRPRIPSPERLNHRERRERKEDLDSESLSSLCSLRLQEPCYFIVRWCLPPNRRRFVRAAERMAHESGGLKSAWQKRGGGSFLAWRLC